MRLALFLLALTACNKNVPPPPDPPEAAPPAAPQAAPWPVGHWRGAIQLPGGIELSLVLHVTHDGTGFGATMDSPDQGAFDIPVSAVTVEGDHVVFTVAAVQGEFTADRSGDDLTGTWSQGGGAFPLTVSPADESGPQKRPQDPVPPFPYLVEEVEIPSVPGVTLAGTLTRPKGDGPFPAVVLVTGSGPQDRDESLLGHRPFAVLADHLTRAGITVLRTDDRGFGKSTGDFQAARTPDFADDAAHALAWLDARADTGATGVLGHSEGGLVAPLLQARSEADAPRARFLVLLAGPAVDGGAILEEQGALIAAANGASAEEVALQRAQTRAAIDAAVAGADVEAMMAAVRAVPGSEEATDDELRAGLQSMASPWFRWFLEFDPTETLQRVDVPVLALFGERDLQVPAAQNSGPMRDALGEHGTVEVLPGLNHLFQPAETGSPSEYAKIETTMDPAMLERVSSWILDVTGQGLAPGPWALTFADGSGNSTRLWREKGNATIHWKYAPTTPEQSSSGTYSGGEPGEGEVDAAGAEALWVEVRRLQNDPTAKAPTRSMGTGLLKITTPAGESTLLVRAPVASDLVTRIEALRAP